MQMCKNVGAPKKVKQFGFVYINEVKPLSSMCLQSQKSQRFIGKK